MSRCKACGVNRTLDKNGICEICEMVGAERPGACTCTELVKGGAANCPIHSIHNMENSNEQKQL